MAGDRIEVTEGPARGEQSELEKELVIGRSTEGFGALKGDPEISRRHAQISRTDEGRLYISDLGSTNGTFVNGEQVTREVELRDLDQVRIGDTEFRFELDVPG
jgi:pSer/pThr/pTyr-binding forkhead associated (FHA) protein